MKTIWVLAIVAAAPDPAPAQNLDAGKPASQIFSEVCANCHRSPREVRNNASASFLREHYTTGGEMASTMAAYLAGVGGDSRGPGGAQPKQKSAPAPAAAAAATTTSRDTSPPDAPRRPQQADPKAVPPPAAPARVRPGAGATEAKLPSTNPPTRPVLEDFEE
ncbi:MAG TPA: hypothetical protein VIY51_14070 [Xanthobacteraceae bacterium]